jgi:rubrerythrin
MTLKGTQTHTNLNEAFGGESMANRRYLYFARVARNEGHDAVAELFEETANGETGHAFGHLDFLLEAGDPATGEPIGDTVANLASAVAGETYEFTAMYPGFARTAREEGFTEIGDWMATLARAEKTHAGRFQKALDTLRADAADDPATV